MDTTVDIAIIGAGTAGLSAFKEASKFNKNIMLIDGGTLGTTCARVGCMPSKALIHIANQYHERKYFEKNGIKGANHLSVSIPEVLNKVREMRDCFTQGVIDFTFSLGEKFINENARFIDKNTLRAGRHTIRAKQIIIATGSTSVTSDSWGLNSNQLLTSETVFEQETLASTIGVIGGGVIGIELGQALARLGVNISLFHSHDFIGTLTDPEVNKVAIDALKNEFDLHLNQRAEIINQKSDVLIEANQSRTVKQIIAAIGRRPNLSNLGLDELDIPYSDNHIPIYNESTMQIENTSIFLTGDSNTLRPLLHEAADEGRIAGYNAAHPEKIQCFKRRIPLRIIFSRPNIAIIGKSFNELESNNIAIGQVDFSDQGRAKIEDKNVGILRIYGSKDTGKILGAECFAPAGEHLAHSLACAIQMNMTAFDALQLPFYHPVIEEGMRTALRDLASQVRSSTSSDFELAMCDSEAISPLS